METTFLQKVRAAFLSAQWEPSEILPVFVARHGSITKKEVRQYSPDYPFVGSAKCFNVERCARTDVWNEQLIPWPWFVALVAKPDDGMPIVDAEDAPDRNAFFYLIYADENGVLPFRIPAENTVELERGFNILRKKLVEHSAPAFRKEHWFRGMTSDLYTKILSEGSSIETTEKGER